MAKWTLGVLGFLVAATALALVRQSAALRDVRSELDQVRDKLRRVEERQREAAGTSDPLKEIREELARVEKKAEAARPAAPESPDKPGALPTYLTEEDIQKIVDERLDSKVDEKVQAASGKQGGFGGDRKMPLHDLAKELTLDPAVQGKVAEISNTAKKEIFAIITTPRADGTNFADELIEVMLKGDSAAATQLFTKLFTEKIPGTDTIYAIGVGNVQQKAHQYLEATLGPDAYTRYKHMNVHPENIETGFDPWGEYIAQKGIDPAKFKKQ